MTKQVRMGIHLSTNTKADIQSHQKLMQFKTLGEYLQFAHNINTHLVNIAKNEGIEMADIPEAIDAMFDCEATQLSLKLFFENFHKQTKEEVK